MLYRLKQLLLEVVPDSWLSFYHLLLAKIGAFLYGYPSEKLVVIGITGTSGKSTTVFILHDLLRAAGFKVGSLSTIAFRINSTATLNDRKMTMLGRFQIQRFLRQMVRSGCTHVIIETTSEGIEQYRHRGIHYDLILFTNLHPEHIEAHGSFANYKKAKLKLFQHLADTAQKVLNQKKIPRQIIVNGDDSHAHDFLNFGVEKRYAYQSNMKKLPPGTKVLEIIWESEIDPNRFSLNNESFHSPFLGRHNSENLIAAVTVGWALGIPLQKMAKYTKQLSPIPGRLEFIKGGQPFDVVVDYAFEPNAMRSLYLALELGGRQYKKRIQVLGGTGGGRDKVRRSILGKMAAEFARIVIVTNEDPYDENPKEIMEQVASGAVSAGKKEGEDLYLIENRRTAIHEAFTKAEVGDLVLITGKGCEQAIVGFGGKLTPWDDRLVARDELRQFSRST